MEDAAAIRAIYNPEVTTGTNTFDLVTRTVSDQRRWIEHHRGALPAIVALAPEDSAVLGFASLSPFRDRAAYATTVENSVYVHADHRGKGVGGALLDELIVRASAHGFHAMIARITATNAASIALHQGRGFLSVGLERQVGRKHGRWLDVVELQRML